MLDAIEWIVPAEPTILEWLRHHRFDCVIASPANMRYSEEIEYVKAARAQRIPCVVPVFSWDNLTTKGLLHVVPDVLLAWHDGHVEEAERLHGVLCASIAITGSPLFDKWFARNAPTGTRDDACRMMGVDPARPYALYLGSSANIVGSEGALVTELAAALRAKEQQHEDYQIVFKPHPANLRAVSELDRAGITVWPREYGQPDTVATARVSHRHAPCGVRDRYQHNRNDRRNRVRQADHQHPA